MNNKNKIPAVFKEDLRKLLYSISEIEPIEKGERICSVCAKVISLDNVQMIIPRKYNTYEYICESPVCVEEFNRKRNKE